MRRLSIFFVMLVFVLCGFRPVQAQTIIERAKAKAQEKLDKKADDAVDKALNTVECAVDDSACAKKAKKDGKKVVLVDEDGKPVKEKSAPTAEAMAPGEGAWANYDFVPGNKLLFAEDFSSDRVGNFPRRLELGSGSMEIVEWKGHRYLRSNDEGNFTITLPELLPQKFTIEAAVLPRLGGGLGNPSFIFAPMPASALTNPSDLYSQINAEDGPGFVTFLEHYAGYKQGNRESITDLPTALAEEVYHVRVMVDGRYVKMYVNEIRVANVPNADLRRSNKIAVLFPGNADKPALIGDIRVSAGGRDMYDALTADGRVATQGIYFDTGSDRLRPESSAALKEIGEMLKEHADLKLMIEGHTDNVGAAATNRSLSEKRAAAVKAYLVEKLGVGASRLNSTKLGDTKPSAPNTTPEGRQQNRRVELVKM